LPDEGRNGVGKHESNFVSSNEGETLASSTKLVCGGPDPRNQRTVSEQGRLNLEGRGTGFKTNNHKNGQWAVERNEKPSSLGEN